MSRTAFTITRFATTADGGSRFEDVVVPSSETRIDEFGKRLPLTPPLSVSNAAPVGGPAKLVFVQLPDDFRFAG